MTHRAGIMVIGAGGHARVIIGAIRAAGQAVEAVYDDNPKRWKETVMGVPIHGPIERLHDFGPCRAVIGIGDARARQAWSERLDLDWLTVVHPRAWIDDSASVGPGSVVFAGAVLQVEARVGAHAIVNTSATIDHNCIVEDYVQVAPGANLCGNVRIGTGAFVGAGAVVCENLTVGRWTIVGAGGTVIRDVPDHVVAVGCPTRIVRSNP